MSSLHPILPRSERNHETNSAHPNFDQTLELLRAHAFDVTPYAGVAGGMLVSKHGAGAVLVAAPEVKGQDQI